MWLVKKKILRTTKKEEKLTIVRVGKKNMFKNFKRSPSSGTPANKSSSKSNGGSGGGEQREQQQQGGGQMRQGGESSSRSSPSPLPVSFQFAALPKSSIPPRRQASLRQVPTYYGSSSVLNHNSSHLAAVPALPGLQQSSSCINNSKKYVSCENVMGKKKKEKDFKRILYSKIKLKNKIK